MSSVVTASWSTAPYAILSLIEQENSTGSWEKGGRRRGRKTVFTQMLLIFAMRVCPVYVCAMRSAVHKQVIYHLADSSNVTPEPIGIQISDVMTIYRDDTWKKDCLITKQWLMYLGIRDETEQARSHRRRCHTA